MFCTKKRTSLFACIVFDGVDVVASGIEPVEGKSLRIFVGEQVSHRQLAGKTAVIFTGDELEVRTLVCKLLNDVCGHHGGNLRYFFEGCEVRYESAVNRFHGSLFQILLQDR